MITVGRISWRSPWLRAGALCLLLSACDSEEAPAPPSTSASPTYIGNAACETCHEEQFSDWSDSQHFLAMQTATEESVVGDFNNTNFKYAGIDYSFFTRNGTYFARADGSDGELQEFEISHTFGIEPLQQYLISFPDGRRQALNVAWDSRPADAGGQRWFHLYPDEEITHGDELHWTGRNFNWNYMCADCHSTNLEKHYEPTSKTYDTTWAEISVGCEACHGPGSAHVVAAQSGKEKNSGLSTTLATQKAELDTCARCHSRRGVIAEGFEPGSEFLDHYRLSLLDEGLYHPDGQILDEVYVYGSFLQSKMYQRGVRCTDCHNPHNAELRASGNEICTRCHQSAPPNDFPTLKTAVYDSPEHHFHEPNSAGAQCVNCHMASKNYMVVDPRRDHSFRIPRPDLTETLGVPNACNGCHDDKTADWALAEIRKRYPAPRPEHYGEAIAAGRARDADASHELAMLAADYTKPAIVRGTALSLVNVYDGAASIEALVAGLNDEAPLVRLGSLAGIRNLDVERRWELAQHLLDDPLLAIRIEAAVNLAPMSELSLRQSDMDRLQSAVQEYIAAQMLNADRPEAMTNLGGIYAQIGDIQSAEVAFQQALGLDPDWLPALVNLADFYRTNGREEDANPLLQRAISVAPDNGDVRYAYGLALVRQGRPDEAANALQEATRLSPENPQYAYVHGIALNSTGRSDEAITALEAGHERFPDNADILFALATIERDRGNMDQALKQARTLLQLRPGDSGVQALVEQLQPAVSK